MKIPSKSIFIFCTIRFFNVGSSLTPFRLMLWFHVVAEDLSDNRFEMILAKRLHDLLKVKDQRAPEKGKRWLEDVAKACTVNENGAFKKALWRRFQYVVAPILAEVIAYVDRDGNLELAVSKDPWISNLWLNVLEDNSFATINFWNVHDRWRRCECSHLCIVRHYMRCQGNLRARTSYFWLCIGR